MRVIFIIQGEGRGHLTQALSLKQMLNQDGHEVVAVMVGKSPSRQLPSFFTEKINAPVFSFESPNFLPSAKNKQVNILKSIGYNVCRSYKYMHSITYINQMIKETNADVVVNFYEMLTGLTYMLFRPKATMICIAHQYLFLHPDFSFPESNKVSLESLKFLTKVTAIGSRRKLALSFSKMREVPSKGIVVVPPLLRKEVIDTKPTKGNYLHGYMVNSGFSEEVKSWHTNHPHESIDFFWDKKGAPEITVVDDKLSFHQLNDTKFLQYLAGCKAYATTAGFESVCEAMYLNKPVLMVPTHIEQACNAHDAMLSGAGVSDTCFDMNALLALSETHKPNTVFQHWVNQSSWLILREFRSDLLAENYTKKPFRRFATNWMYRLSHRLPL